MKLKKDCKFYKNLINDKDTFKQINLDNKKK